MNRRKLKNNISISIGQLPMLHVFLKIAGASRWSLFYPTILIFINAEGRQNIKPPAYRKCKDICPNEGIFEQIFHSGTAKFLRKPYMFHFMDFSLAHIVTKSIVVSTTRCQTHVTTSKKMDE